MKINCFIPFQSVSQVKETVLSLKESELVNKIYLLKENDNQETIEGCDILDIDTLRSTATIKKIVSKADAEYTLIYTKSANLRLGMFALDRMLQIAEDSGAGMVYADHYQIANNEKKNSPVITYQKGSLRDDFNFGSVLIYKSDRLKKL